MMSSIKSTSADESVLVQQPAPQQDGNPGRSTPATQSIGGKITARSSLSSTFISGNKVESSVSTLSHNPHSHFYTDSHLDETMEFIATHLPPGWSPQVAIICGSGLGGLCSLVTDIEPGVQPLVTLDYSDIPHFSSTTVQGHHGKLVFGKLGGADCVCMVGRFHFYEGYALYQTTYPVRIFSLLGVKQLIVTNAAGSLNHPKCENGDIMIIRDHINMPGLAGHNPLVGVNMLQFGPRFPATSDSYSLRLRKLARELYLRLGYSENTIQEGVYVFVAGPSYETPAEARFLNMIGADAVGMSTVPEVIVARHCNIEVLGLSLITNKVVMPDDKERMERGDPIEKATHEEVLEMSRKRAFAVQSLVEAICASQKDTLICRK